MPTIYDLKPRFQALLQPVVDGLARRGATANQVTLAACALSVALGIGLALRPALFALLPPFLFLRMALNAIDGMLARQYNQKSALGGLLNEVGDVVSDAALYLPFATLAGVDARIVVAAVFFAMLTEFVGVCAVAIGASRRYDGPMGKSDRAFVFGALALWVALGGTAVTGATGLNIVIGLVAAMSAMTCVKRAKMALRRT